MKARRTAALLLAAAMAFAGMVVPGLPAPVRAAEYTLESIARYEVRPEEREIGVNVELTFTNTTPDPDGRFSVFDEIRLAIHDEATEVAASDDDGALEVSAAVADDVNVATIELREGLRYEDSVTVELTYILPDGNGPQLRIRPSVVVFPAWSFGTSGEVSVAFPAGFELRVDGDSLSEDGDRLTSGPIEDPGRWLALVTGIRAGEMVDFEATVPLEGGTADLLVRAFGDDEAWGERTLAIVQEALPSIEEEVGLPYPLLGRLVLSEVVPSDRSGFGEDTSTGTEILVAFDQPPFTALHQLTHVWLTPELVEARWIREGLASRIAARVAEGLEVDPPYAPAEEAERLAGEAFQLDTWTVSSAAELDAYGYAGSWAFVEELEASVGPEALRSVLVRVAASLGPYESGEIDPEPGGAGSLPEPAAPLTTRSFLDHLETVAGVDLTQLFRERVLTEADAALLGPRAEARAAMEALVESAGGWGAPDPVRSAMAAWSFEDATAQIESASAWLDQRDILLEAMSAAGLTAPDRLQQAYRAYGGGAEATAELAREEAVVSAYASTAAEANEERSFVERIGLVGGPDPDDQLVLANGRFTDGDLRGSVEAITEAQQILAAAETGGIVRLVSLALVVLIVAALAVVLFRRRAAYTAAR